MPTSAEQLIQDALSQLRDEQTVAAETINLLRGQLQDEVARNVRLSLQLSNLSTQMRAWRREANGKNQ